MKNLYFIIYFLTFPFYLFSQNVEVQGSLKIVDGTQGENKVLTSDADGLASWMLVSPPSASDTYYKSVNMCCNSWMTENLDVNHYRNGDPIPHVSNATDWENLTTGAYCYYMNDSTTYAAVYGKLYNWYAVNDPRGLAPEGWHIPTYIEWESTISCLGGITTAGGPLKEMGTTNWTAPNTGATNLSGFSALPGGFRSSNGSYDFIGDFGSYWTASEDDVDEAWNYSFYNNNDDILRVPSTKVFGLSVRCVRD